MRDSDRIFLREAITESILPAVRRDQTFRDEFVASVKLPSGAIVTHEVTIRTERWGPQPSKPDKIFVLDPAARRAGWAVLATDTQRTLLDGGLFKLDTDKDPFPRLDEFRRDIIAEAARIGGLTVGVVEITSGHAARRFGNQRMAGMAIYGAAVYAGREGLREAGMTVHDVPENLWTGGKKKAKRTMYCGQLYGTQYDPKRDPGGDFADAIMLGRWWIAAQEATTWKGIK